MVLHCGVCADMVLIRLWSLKDSDPKAEPGVSEQHQTAHEGLVIIFC